MILDVLNVCDFDAMKLHILEYFLSVNTQFCLYVHGHMDKAKNGETLRYFIISMG